MSDAKFEASSMLRRASFSLSKFRPTALPPTLVPRLELLERLEAGAGSRLTVVVGSEGAGKSVLLANWASARRPSPTAWLSCDEADAAPLRFWLGFIEAVRSIAPDFGADAAELLAIDGEPSADAVESLANDLSALGDGMAIIVDDYHFAGVAVGQFMNHLVERCPPTVQMVLVTRAEPPLPLHRLRMRGELCELRNAELLLSLDDSRRLLDNFGIDLAPPDLALIQERTEGWVTAVQLAALTLHANHPLPVADVLDLPVRTIADYFVGEVLDRQPKNVTNFMLDISILDELAPSACRAVTGQSNAHLLLRRIYKDNLFVIAANDKRSSYRYHHLIRDVLRAELHAADPTREMTLHTRAAEWFASMGDHRQAMRHWIRSGDADSAFQMLFERVLPDFFSDPSPDDDLGAAGLEQDLVTQSPGHVLALALDLFLRGHWDQGAKYLDLLDDSEPVITTDSQLASRLYAVRSLRHALFGEVREAIEYAAAARSVVGRAGVEDDWIAFLPLVLINVHTWVKDYDAVEREVQAALGARPHVVPVVRVHVPAVRALAMLEAGEVNAGEALAKRVASDASQLGLDRDFMAVNYWRTLALAALEHGDLAEAQPFADTALMIAERGRPAFEFLAQLDRAEIQADGGQFGLALATIDTARTVLHSSSSVLLERADEHEAMVRLAWGDPPGAKAAAARVSEPDRSLLGVRIALAESDIPGAIAHLGPEPLDSSVPRYRLLRRIFQAAIAIEQGRTEAADLIVPVIEMSERWGFLNLVVKAAPQLTTYLVEHASGLNQSAYLDRLVAAAVEVRAGDPVPFPSGRDLPDPLTERELDVLRLLPTSLSFTQMAATLFVTVNTVKTHSRRIYKKLHATSRSEAVDRAVELRMLRPRDAGL